MNFSPIEFSAYWNSNGICIDSPACLSSSFSTLTFSVSFLLHLRCWSSLALLAWFMCQIEKCFRMNRFKIDINKNPVLEYLLIGRSTQMKNGSNIMNFRFQSIKSISSYDRNQYGFETAIGQYARFFSSVHIYWA